MKKKKKEMIVKYLYYMKYTGVPPVDVYRYDMNYIVIASSGSYTKYVLIE